VIGRPTTTLTETASISLNRLTWHRAGHLGGQRRVVHPPACQQRPARRRTRPGPGEL